MVIFAFGAIVNGEKKKLANSEADAVEPMATVSCDVRE